MNNKVFIAGALIVGALFVYGIVDLMLLRFEAGDVYPPYSSLRSDPLGTKALYESLRSCCNLNVSRNYEDFSKLKDHQNTVILILGVTPADFKTAPKDLLDDLNFFVRNGGRLALTLVPVQKLNPLEELDLNLGSDTDEDLASLQDEWGFRINDASLSPAEGKGKAHLKVDDIAESEPLSCYTSIYFDRLPVWRVIYSRGIHPVVIERRMGKGTIVLSSISYFLSNEAMLRERRPELLGWLIGPNKNVIFDELYHGVNADRGVAYLIRKYHLQWFVGGLLLLSVLFVWKNASSLVPASDSYAETSMHFARGKESAAGLTNLLRRTIPSKSIFRICYQEWRKSLGVQSGLLKTKLNLTQTIADRESNPIVAYNAVAKILSERE